MKVCWLSAGVSSFVAGYLAEDVDKYIYIDIADQHPDSMRFIKDCEGVLGKPIEILRSTEYNSVEDCVRAFGGFRNIRSFFSPCTNWLKKRVRKEWEMEQTEPLTYVWGMDYHEKHRADRIIESMPQFEHEFPLIDKGLTKQEAHGICSTLGIKRPVMYDMGYSNNNCIGCVKGGKGYWNKIRQDFPDVFAGRAKLEKDMGQSILNGVFLDELDPTAGRQAEEIMEECDIFCMITMKEGK